MGLRDEIHDMDEYQSQKQATEQAAKTTATGGSGQAATLADALAPVLNWEKSDAEFWLQVAQLLVLLAILYHTRRKGGAI